MQLFHSDPNMFAKTPRLARDAKTLLSRVVSAERTPEDGGWVLVRRSGHSGV
jgi:hypothetical protein